MATNIDVPVGKIVTGIVLVILVVAGIVTLFGSWYNIPEGSVGIMFHSFGANQGFDRNTLQQGWGMKMPFRDKVYTIPFRTQTIAFLGTQEAQGANYGSIQPKDSNGITFDVDVVVRYHLDPVQASYFVEQKGEGIASMESILATAVRADSTRGVFGKYAQEDVPALRQDLAVEVKDILQKRIDEEATRSLKPGFIVVEAVDIRNVKFNDQIDAAIITKQKAKQVAEQKQYELQQAETQRNITLVQADMDRQAAILRATGDAEAIKLVAFGKAAGIDAVNKAYQNMPNAYVQAKFADAIKANDKIIFGLENFQNGGLNFMDTGKVAGLYASGATGTTQ